MKALPNESELEKVERTLIHVSGMPVCVEGSERVPAVATAEFAQSPVEARSRQLPTAAKLAGVPICVEGREDLVVRRVVRRNNA